MRKASPSLKKKKTTTADLIREWHIPLKYIKGGLRYTGIAGVYWYWLSRQVRQEDFATYKGKCVSCKAVLDHWQDGDCGHFVASGDGGFATRFLRENLALQCKRCNNPAWVPDAGAFYAVELDKRYGYGTAERLLNLKGVKQKEMKPEEYAVLIRALPSFQEAQGRGYPQDE